MNIALWNLSQGGYLLEIVANSYFGFLGVKEGDLLGVKEKTFP